MKTFNFARTAQRSLMQHRPSGHKLRLASLAPAALGLLLAVFACACRKDKSGTGTPSAAPSSSGSKSKISATKEQPFENSLGMKFVPVSGTKVFFSIWETRMQDYMPFVESTSGPQDWAAAGWAARKTYPAENISWQEATAYCHWLTERERKEGRLGAKDVYRLPTDKEWDAAIGSDLYPWGNKWPKSAEWKSLPGYMPDKDNTAPVGSFAPNKHGLHDLGGNVFEWVQDWYRADMNSNAIKQEDKRLREDGGGHKFKVLRGASWIFWDAASMQCSYRFINTPDARSHLYGFRCVLAPDGAK